MSSLDGSALSSGAIGVRSPTSRVPFRDAPARSPAVPNHSVIETTDIRVDYDDLTAVTDVTLSIEAGEIYGLIGPNGAGKTSLIRVLATLRTPTYGSARIAGFDTVEQVTMARRHIGYMPDLAPVYKELKCWEFLDLFAGAYHLPRRERRARVDACLAKVDLTAKRDLRAGTLSRGMTQRLVLAKTLLHEPSVLLLDEPASGLDPMARIDLRNLLRELAADGRTVVISSHILNELSDFCTSIGIMEKGHLVVDGDLDTIVASLNPTRRFALAAVGDVAIAAAVAALEARDDVSQVVPSAGGCIFEFVGDDAAAAGLLATLVGSGIAVSGFHERRRGVEDVVRRVSRSEGA